MRAGLAFFVLFAFFPVAAGEKPAQLYLELLEKENGFQDGYYNGEATFLFPERPAEVLRIELGKSKENLLWNFYKEQDMSFRVLCRKKEETVYLYDKRRDYFKKYGQKFLLQEIKGIPAFLFCGVIFAKILDPARIEKHGEKTFIRSHFYFPGSNHEANIIFSGESTIHEIQIYRRNTLLVEPVFTVIPSYNGILRKTSRETQLHNVSFPVRIDILDTKKNAVVLLKLLFFHEGYKIDDTAFLPEFLTR